MSHALCQGFKGMWCAELHQGGSVECRLIPPQNLRLRLASHVRGSLAYTTLLYPIALLAQTTVLQSSRLLIYLHRVGAGHESPKNMPSQRVRTRTCRSLALVLLSLAASRTAAFASAAGEGAAAAAASTADSAFVPPAATTRGWFGGIQSSKPSAPTDNTASISARPTSAFAPSTKAGVRTWVPAKGASSRAASARREAMAMDAVGESNAAPKIIIAGAPASGKGTQCSLIKERYGVVHLSTGAGVHDV